MNFNQAQGVSPTSPDPLLTTWVGSGHETSAIWGNTYSMVYSSMEH